MAAPVGLEPTTSRLTAACSAIELWGNEWEVAELNRLLAVYVLRTGYAYSGTWALLFTNFPQTEAKRIVRVASPLEKLLTVYNPQAFSRRFPRPCRTTSIFCCSYLSRFGSADGSWTRKYRVERPVALPICLRHQTLRFLQCASLRSFFQPPGLKEAVGFEPTSLFRRMTSM